MPQKLILLVLLATLACKPSLRPPLANDPRVAAAAFFTEQYAHSRFSKWDIRAQAAGSGCDVLLVRTSQVMDDSMIEAIHYGAGPYEIVRGGVQGFYQQRAFRGVVYSDPTKRFWTFGAIAKDEAPALSPCR